MQVLKKKNKSRKKYSDESKSLKIDQLLILNEILNLENLLLH